MRGKFNSSVVWQNCAMSRRIFSFVVTTFMSVASWGAMAQELAVSPQSTTVRNDAPVVLQSELRTSSIKEPTKVTTYLPVNAVYNISTLDERLRQYIPDLKRPTVALLSGGQPMPQAWEHVANAGVKTVINLRPRSELGLRDEAAEVRAAGLNYVEIPIYGPTHVNDANGDKLWAAMKASTGGVLVHCATGDRAAALLALAVHHNAGLNKHEALEFGLQSGLKSLRPVVEAALGITPTPAPAAVTAPAKKP